MIHGPRFVAGNQPIALDSDTPAAMLVSGSAVVFAVDRETGERIHLFSLDMGEPVLPLPCESGSCWQIVVVPLEISYLQPLGNLLDMAGIFALENWLAKMGEALSLFRPAGQARILSSAQDLILPHGQRVAIEEGLTLVRMGSGRGVLSGAPLPEDSSILLVPGLWLEADTPGTEAEWRILDGSLSGAAAFLQPTLDLAARILFAALNEVRARREDDQKQRLATRLEMNAQAGDNALLDLSAISGAPPATRGSNRRGADPLFEAVRMVADSHGIAVKASAGYGSLRDIANASGFRTRTVSLSGNWWRADNGPLVAFRSDGSPVALLPAARWFGRVRYRIADPLTASRIPVNAGIAVQLQGLAQMIYRPLPEDLSARSLLRYGLTTRRADLRTILIAGIAAAVLGLAGPQGTAILIGQAIPDADTNMVWQVASGMVAAAFGSTLFLLTQSVATLRAQTAAFIALQSGVWDYLLKLGPSFFRGFTAGQLRMRADAVTRIHQIMTADVLRSFFSGAASFLFFALMLWYSPGLSLIALLAGAVMIGTSWIGTRALYRVQQQWQDTDEVLSGLVLQAINAVSKIRIAGAANRAFSFWAHEYSRKQKLALSLQTIRDRIQIVNSVTPGLAVALGFFTLLSTPLPLGSFLACIAAMSAFLTALSSASGAGARIAVATSLWQRMYTILASTPEVGHGHTHPGRLRGAIAVDNLTFRYRGGGPLILDGISIRAEPGECVALTGPSGGGKSTLLNLILRFETPASGAIYLDGRELSSLDIGAVRRQIGVVTQDGRLMAGSVFDNICSGGVNTMDEAWDAARAAGLAADIEAMPMGMHTMVSEGGGNFSGGQRQRLLIARALVLKPALLFFDEATSALDNRTQAIVTASLKQLRATRILIAHRLSTIQSADRIYVIDKGKVVQQGTYTQLLSEPGLFARLASRQKL